MKVIEITIEGDGKDSKDLEAAGLILQKVVHALLHEEWFHDLTDDERSFTIRNSASTVVKGIKEIFDTGNRPTPDECEGVLTNTIAVMRDFFAQRKANQ